MTDKPRTYAKPKESGGISFKNANGNHISVALKKTQKWKCVFNDEIGKYILSYHNVKLSIGKELFSFTFEVIQEGGE